MTNEEQILDAVRQQGKLEWEVLANAIKDIRFQNLLTDQEKQILEQVKSNPNIIGNYREYIANIVAKYYGWQVNENAGLMDLKKEVVSLAKQVKTTKGHLDAIEKTAGQITGATVLVKYSEAFSNAAVRHKGNADTQLKYYLYSLFALVVVIGLIFFVSVAEFPILRGWMADDLKNLPLNTGIFALKAIVLLFVFQISQFFRKNYNAEKHLEEVYRHRSDVLQSLHAVFLAITDPEERSKILSAGALFAYERGETGYITTKEGAGSSDSILDTILSKKLGI